MKHDLQHAIEIKHEEDVARVRNWLFSEGRPDIVAKFDKEMKDIRSGAYAARMCWHSISPAQRRALSAAGDSGALVRMGKQYNSVAGSAGICRLKTIRALIAHELLDCDGGAFDPESRVVISDRGRFVLNVAKETAECG